jgi:predicted permease
MALGANRWRLARQMLTESIVLSMVAAAPGLLLAVAGVRALVAFAPAGIPRLDEITVDSAALVFTFCISLVAGLLFGIVPAFEISRNAPIESIKKSSQGSGGRVARTRGLLMIAEFAAAVTLLTGAGLLVRSFILIRTVDPGFRPEHVLFVEIPHSWSRDTPEKRVAFYSELVDRVQSVPGVRAAGVTADFFILPEPEGKHLYSVSIEGRAPVHLDQLTGNAVSPGYFQALGVPLLRGRFFSDRDGPNTVPLAIVNQALGRSLWPGADPVGKRFSPSSKPPATWYTVVGVVGDMRRERPELPPTPQYFQPQTQRSIWDAFLAARLDNGTDSRGLPADILAIIRSMDKTQPRPKVAALEELLGEMESNRRFQTSLLSLFSLIALGLASVGIYGLTHYSVAQRTREIGIRMAFGARRADVLGMVIRQALGLAMTGIAVGMTGAYAVARTIATLLYGVKPTDPATFAGVGLVILAATLTASCIPAWRATKVDPMVALHYE